MKVEQALQLLPGLEALAPLRALLLSSARIDDRGPWASSGLHLTIGKRDVEPGEMRQRMAGVLQRITTHLAMLFEAYVDALEALDRRDAPEAVKRLRAAGRLEETVGRLDQARAWYAAALTLAEGLKDRRPEVEALLSLARLSLHLGYYEESARDFQRALVLAEFEIDQRGAITACEGLGMVATEQARWAGAQAWYSRGMRLAEATGDARCIGDLHHAMGEFARRKGDLTIANEELRQAREQFEPMGDARAMARVVTTQGLVDADLGVSARAAGSFREALAWMRRVDPEPGLEVFIRLNFAKLHLEVGRYLEAEEEARRAEQVAVAHHLIRRLVQIYCVLGNSRGRQGDEAGFVFFEQAIDLARMIDRAVLIEAQVYYEYGVFYHRVGRQSESRAYLERAREIFESLDARADVRRVQAELRELSA